LAGLLLAALTGRAAEWQLSYFYDKPTELLRFTDVAFPSALRGVAVGVIQDQRGVQRNRSVAMVTADGGEHWAEVKLDDLPYSLFFLDDSTGWMVTAQGVWMTQESGRTWKRVSKHSTGSLQRVWFIDHLHGFAAAREKTVLETKDGGRHWTSVAAAKDTPGKADYAVYTHIAFLDGKTGLIAGSAVPPVRRGINTSGRQIPTMTIQLQTTDGGLTWKPSAAPLFGVVDGVNLNGANGLVLFRYDQDFEVPSEVYRLNLRGGDSTSLFRAENRRVTSMALFGTNAYLAAIEPPSKAPEARGISGRVHVLTSSDWRSWAELPVDYRARGTSVVLSGPDASHLFLATDEGMILRLVP
jgi:photosystem II stability/assembly factor-like uncharacterized protein